MLISVRRPLALQARHRAAFTLLEVLVVVAILVILASVAGIAVFGYLEGAKEDTAKQQITALEGACTNYMVKNGGDPPATLQEIVAPTTPGALPLLDGGLSALKDPWGGMYQYEIVQDPITGSPSPFVYTTNPKTGQQVISPKRTAMNR